MIDLRASLKPSLQEKDEGLEEQDDFGDVLI